MGAKDWRYEFWIYLIGKLSSQDPWYKGFKPRKAGAIEKSSKDAIRGIVGKDGVFFCFIIRNNYAKVTVTIQGDSLGPDRINNYFYQLKENEEVIKSKLSMQTDEWTPAPSTKKSPKARIPTIIRHPGTDSQDWWDECVDELRRVMDEYREVISPFIDNLVDDETTYYYVIQIQKPNGQIIFKAGITKNPRNRFENQHKKNFAKHPDSENWKLTLEEIISFDTWERARTFENKVKYSEIRAPKIDKLSDELFVSHPLEYAREKSWI